MSALGRLVSMQRLANRIRTRNYLLSVPVSALYRFVALYFFSVDIPVSTKLGKNVLIFHGFGLVVHPNAVIGDDVILRQGVTIGATQPGRDAKAPVIQNSVEIGAGAIILGDVTIGRKAKIGAGAIVLNDVPAGAV